MTLFRETCKSADFLITPVLKTGLTPSASGSAYLELDSTTTLQDQKRDLRFPDRLSRSHAQSMGPRPLPRSAPFSPNLLLSTHVKFAPFATRQRRGYVRDSTETDLAVHLETAIRGVIIGDRWPKSGVDVVVTILEAEESGSQDITNSGESDGEPWGLMNVLSGCITVASAAIADAGIDSVDLVVGGAAAIVSKDGSGNSESAKASQQTMIVSDPYLSEHPKILGACVVGYLPARDEITELWALGSFSNNEKIKGGDMDRFDKLMEQAVRTALYSRSVLGEALKEGAQSRLRLNDRQMEAP